MRSTCSTMWCRAVVYAVVTVASLDAPGLAQTPLGSLVGTVRDASGAVMPGVELTVQSVETGLTRSTASTAEGGFSVVGLPPGGYRLRARASGFAASVTTVHVGVGTTPTVKVVLHPEGVTQSVVVQAGAVSLAAQPLEATSAVQQTVIGRSDLDTMPLAHRSFANIAYLSPMTEPVEPSDPTKARITAVSFAGSSGLNVDLSVDGGDNNDDYIGGFLQNYSPDAIQEFVVRTAQFDADTSRTNGGSVIISTRRGTDRWHGSAAGFFRERGLNARNTLDNPEPSPKQPYSRQDGSFTVGGPIVGNRLWFFSSLEMVAENASVAYSGKSLSEFRSLAQLAAAGLIPGVTSIDVPTSVSVPFRDAIFSTRVDWAQSARSQWFARVSFDRNRTSNDLVQQGTLPSTGTQTRSNYLNVLVGENYQFSSGWLGTLTLGASAFHHTKERNSNLGLALAFPFSATAQTTSGFETFGDNQFVTAITAFPVRRDQEKYQLRYDVVRTAGAHTLKGGVNLIHEPVLNGELSGTQELLVQFPNDPSFYVGNPAQFAADFAAGSTLTPAAPGAFSQSIRRLGVYVQDAWRIRPALTLDYGVRYDTTFGLFVAEGRDQSQNPGFVMLQTLGIPLVSGIPHDYRKAIAPRLGLAWAPGASDHTVVRLGAGLYYNDLTQNGWVDAFRAVDTPSSGPLGPGDQGAVIDPNYRTPLAIQASAGVEHDLGYGWRLNVFYEHQQGIHQYRRYEYVSGFTLPDTAPSVSVFRTDNRSQYDGVSVMLTHRLARLFEMTAHYTLARANTWGATVGELFDYVNGVTDVRNAFGPGDHGPSGEDVRHRLLVAGTLTLPGRVHVSGMAQFESARPFTMSTPVDLNGDGLSTNDRAVVNGVPTTLDQFRGTPFEQIDVRVSCPFTTARGVSIVPFVELFNLFNRMNPGNNYVTDVGSLGVPPGELANVQHLCLNAACTTTRAVQSLSDLKVPAGALGDFFGPGTTVGIPFAAQLGVRVTF
jgi:hypothetical protein